MIKKSAIILVVAIIGLSGCKSGGDKEYQTGEGDMLYKIHRDDSGPTIKELDFMAVTIVEKTEGDSVLYNMYDYDGRSVVLVRDKSRFKGDLSSAYGLLSEGDSATFKINVDSITVSEGKKRTANIKGKYLVYTIKVNKVLPRGSLSDSEMNAQIEAYRAAEVQKAKATERVKIERYIVANKLKPRTTASGLRYIITKKGTGPAVQPGDTMLVNYTSRYLSGKLFYTTNGETAKREGKDINNEDAKYGPGLIIIPIEKSNSPYSALQEASLMFPKGTKVTLIFPSSMGYDDSQRGVPQYSPLISEMEILDIKKRKNNSKSIARIGI